MEFVPILRWMDYGGFEKKLKSLSKRTDEFLQALIDEQRHKEEEGSTMIDHMLSSLVFSWFFLFVLLLLFASLARPKVILYPQFYDHSCPKAQEIVRSVLAKAVAKEARMAALILRLHFHDCFGCDASLLLDIGGSIVSEKGSNPSRNSIRGFEVLDEIKSALDKECPCTRGGPSWEVLLGRRDSRSASLSGSNNNLPAPNNTFQTILTKFKRQGLDIVDLRNRSHTIGNARCTSFRQRLYKLSGNGQPDYTLDQSYAAQLKIRCPKSGGDQNLFFLDYVSPTKFDNYYYKNILASKGLLSSDQVLLTKNEGSREMVKKYAENSQLFFEQFAKSRVKMGNISPLTGSRGEIRKNCRKVNS
ncbi:peroxidase 72 [Quercus suber]|uniref:Peroxidase n=1 Tax=Quercus suber TaxID=58331 RepID=A0AAW0IQT0_QUESU